MFQVAIAALVVATLFTGAALYISLVEHPARLGLADGPLLAQWQLSYKLALPIQSGLAIAGGATGLTVGYHSADLPWFAGSTVLLANWPLTLLVTFPVNKRLMAMPESEAGSHSRAKLVQWGKLHNIRSALGIVTALIFTFAMTSFG